MKKYKYIIATIFVCVFSASAVATARADTPVNLIQNPSLETASATSAGTPQYWNWDYFGNNKPTFTYPVPGHLGGVAAKIDMVARTTGDAKWFFDPVQVVPGTQYTFGDYYMSTVSTMVTVQYMMQDGSFRYQNLGVAKKSPNSWQQFSAMFTVPANVTKVSVFHRIRRVGSLTVDDYSLTANPNLLPIPPPQPVTPTPTDTTDTSGGSASSTPPVVPPTSTSTPVTPPSSIPSPSTSPNLILNPTLESQTNGTPDYWFTDVEGTTTATFSYPIPGYNGNSAVQTTETSADPNGDAKWIWDPVTVDANGDYQFSEYYMSSAVNVVIVEFNMSDGTRQFTNLVTLQPVTAWTEVNKEFNVRPGTVSVTVLDVLRQVGTLSVSDVSLKKLSDGTFDQGIVSLSFDDDDLTFYTGALTPLLSHNFMASENVVDDWIGQPTYMTASQITEINKDGMAIGSHSISHPYLTTLSDADATHEIADSKSTFLSMGFTPISVFVYPYGDLDDRIEGIVKNSGYIAGRGTDQGFNTKNSDVYDLRTENVEANTTVAQVETWIDQAKQNKTWLILGFHDVSNTPIDEYTITPATFQAILGYLNQTKVQVSTTEYVVGNLMK